MHRPSALAPGPSASPSRALGPVGQLGPELQHGLGVDLAHPALGDPQDVADLGQGQAFVVVEGEHGLLPLGHLADGLDQRLLGLLDLEGVHRAGGAVREGLPEGRPVRAVAATGRPRRGPPRPTNEILRKAVWNSASVISRSAATSASVGVRCRVASSLGTTARRRGPWPEPTAAPSRSSGARR